MVDRLRQHWESERSAPRLGGRELTGPGANDPFFRVGLGALNALGLFLEADQQTAKGLAGAALIANAKLNPLVRSGLGNKIVPYDSPLSGTRVSREAEAGYNAARGNPFQRAIAGHEEAARGDEIGVGLMDATWDPLNLTALGGPLATAGGKVGKVGRALELLDKAQALPFKPLEKYVLGPGFRRLGQGLSRLAQQPNYGIAPGLVRQTGEDRLPELYNLIGQEQADELRGLFPAIDPGELSRIINEGSQNQPAIDFANYVNQNWDRARAGQFTEDDIINAYVPAILSQRRRAGKPSVHLANMNRPEQLVDKYPALAGPITEGLTIGGGEAGKHRPEDLAALMLHYTNEGRDLASALKYGDRDAIQTAMDQFNAIWPDAGFFPGAKGDRFGGERGALTRMGEDEVFRSVAQMINRMASEGATGDEVAQVMRDWFDATNPKVGGAWKQAYKDQFGKINANPMHGESQIVDRIANGKSGFLTTNLGGPSATFDVRVEKAMKPGATIDDYRRALAIMYPGDDEGLAHHKFWDSQSIDQITGQGGKTPHLGIEEGVRLFQGEKKSGRRLGDVLFPAPADRITPGLAKDLERANTYIADEATPFLANRPERSYEDIARQRYQREFLDGRAQQDMAILKEQARNWYARKVAGAENFDAFWDHLTSRLEDLKTISMGVGDAADARKIADSGMGFVNGFRLRGVKAGDGSWPQELVRAKARALGLAKGQPRYDEALAFGAARGINDPRAAVDAYASYFLDIEAHSFEMIGSGNPRLDPEATMPTYASITEGQPALNQMGGGIHMLFDPDATDYVASIHHPFMMASETVLPMHKGTSANLKGVWGPERQGDLAAAAGRPEVQRFGPEGDWGVSGSPLIGSPAATSALRAASLIATDGGAILKKAAADPEAAAVELLRGGLLKQRGPEGSFTRNLAGNSSAKRSEALLINPTPQSVTGILVKGQSAEILKENVAAARYLAARLGIPEVPIYVAYGPEGVVPGVFQLTPEGPVRAYLNRGRAALVNEVRNRGLADYGATPGLANRAGKYLTENLLTVPGSNRLRMMAEGGIGGFAAGGLAPADDNEERLRNARIGAGLGAGAALGVTTPVGRVAAREAGTLGATALGRLGGGLGRNAAVGAGLGAGYGAAADEENRGRGAVKGALFGAAAGASLGALAPELGRGVRNAWVKAHPAAADNTVVSDKALAIAHRVASQAQEDAAQTQGATLAQLPRAVDDFWRAQVVNTFRGLGLDAASLWILVKDFGRDFGVDRLGVKRTMGELIDNFDDPDPLRRIGVLGDTIEDWGLESLVDDTTGLEQTLGTGFGAAELGRDNRIQLSAPQRALAGAGLSLVNLRDWVVPVVGPVYGAVRGHYAPYLDAAYRTLNNFQHAAPRIAFWNAALKRDLPVAGREFARVIAPTGINLDPLFRSGAAVRPSQVGQYLVRHYKGLTTQEVNQIERLYAEQLNVAAMKSADRIAHIFGDFREKNASPWKTFLSRVFPFSRYAMEYAPVALEMAKRHPYIAGAALGGTALSALAATRNGEPPWQGGTVPVSTETPVLGGLARLRLGGQQGTVRVDPISQFMGPISAQTFAGVGDTENKSPYDVGSDVLEMGGFSPHPAITMLANLMGESRKPIGPMSRTANIENAAELIPGMPTVPTVAGKFTEAKGQFTGEKQYDFDRVARRYAELVLEQSGDNLSATVNRDLHEALGDEDNPLWRQARQEVRLADLVGGLLSNATPVSSSGQTATNAAYHQYRNARPDDQQLAEMANGDYRLLDKLNVLRAQMDKNNPVGQVYKGASTQGRLDRITYGMGGLDQYMRNLIDIANKDKYQRKDR